MLSGRPTQVSFTGIMRSSVGLDHQGTDNYVRGMGLTTTSPQILKGCISAVLELEQSCQPGVLPLCWVEPVALSSQVVQLAVLLNSGPQTMGLTRHEAHYTTPTRQIWRTLPPNPSQLLSTLSSFACPGCHVLLRQGAKSVPVPNYWALPLVPYNQVVSQWP